MPEIVFLLVEDTDTDALLVKIEMARYPGVRLMTAIDGQEAIDYLLGKPPYDDRKQFPLPDVILLDLKMPRISGFDFLKWRREEALEAFRLIPVIVLSGSSLTDDVRRAYALGANCFMSKPTGLDVLRQRMALTVDLWGRHTELVTRNMPASDLVAAPESDFSALTK
jgi:CheY-like chemotaxis protein